MLTGIALRLMAPLLLVVPFTLVLAAPLPAPTGNVILVLSGDVANTNVGDEAHFDRAMLDALPSRTIETHTPWHRDMGRYEGPLMRALLERAGAGDSALIRIRALNRYEADVPVADFQRYDVILAMRRDGAPLSVRDYGPLFVLYPFDSHPELHTEAIRFRSVWHVERIIVP